MISTPCCVPRQGLAVAGRTRTRRKRRAQAACELDPHPEGSTEDLAVLARSTAELSRAISRRDRRCRGRAREISGQTFGTACMVPMTVSRAGTPAASSVRKSVMPSSRSGSHSLTRMTVGGSPATSSVPAKIGHASGSCAGRSNAIGVAAPLPNTRRKYPSNSTADGNVSPSRSSAAGGA